MRKKNLCLLLLPLLLAAPSRAPGSEPVGDGPCQVIKEACIAAGYKIGKSAGPGKALFINCMLPVLRGQAAANVAADPKDIEDCRIKGENSSKLPGLSKALKQGGLKPSVPPKDSSRKTEEPAGAQ